MKRWKISWFFVIFFLLLPVAGYVIEAVCLLMALAIHELGHIIVARGMGFRVEKLEILPLGGYMHLDQLMELQPQAEERIALAGPLANLLAVAFVMAVIRYSQRGQLAIEFLQANLTFMAFNLLPALPLDGGRVLRARLSTYLPFFRATKIVICLGILCGVILLSSGVYWTAIGRPNPTVFAAGIFLLYNAYGERKRLLIPLIRYAFGRQRHLKGAKLLTALSLVAAPGTVVNDVLKHIRPQKYYQVSVLDEDYSIAGILTEHQLLGEITAGSGQRQLKDLVKRKEG